MLTKTRVYITFLIYATTLLHILGDKHLQLNIFSLSKVSLYALNNVNKGVILKLLPLMVGVRVRRTDDYNQLGPMLLSNSECAVLTFKCISVYVWVFFFFFAPLQHCFVSFPK